MKTVKTSLLAIALFAGVTMAFATKHSKENTKMDTLVWYQTISDSDPSPDLNSTEFESAEAAQTALGCNGSNDYCAAEFNVDTQLATGQTIKKQ